MWLIKIVLLGLTHFFNAIYRFLPEKLIKKFPKCIKIVGIIVALILVVHFICGEVFNYINYSFAVVSKNGDIIKSRNFKHKIEKIKEPNGNMAYIIKDKYDLDNLNIKVSKVVTPEISIIVKGIKIIFIANGFGNPVVESDFIVEIKK